MYFMATVDICTKDYLPLWNIVGFVVNTIKIGIPIVLVLYGMIDLGKAVIANSEDGVKKATKLLGKRFLYAVGVFASVWIVTTVLWIASDTVGKNNDDYDYDEASWKSCWALINGENPDEGCYTCVSGDTYRWGDYSEDSSCKKTNKSKGSCKKEEKKCYKLTTDIGESYVWQEPSKSRDASYEEVSSAKTEKACLDKNGSSGEPKDFKYCYKYDEGAITKYIWESSSIAIGNKNYSYVNGKDENQCLAENKKCYKLTLGGVKSYVKGASMNRRDSNYEEVDMNYCK